MKSFDVLTLILHLPNKLLQHSKLLIANYVSFHDLFLTGEVDIPVTISVGSLQDLEQ